MLIKKFWHNMFNRNKTFLTTKAWQGSLKKFLVRPQYLKIETTNICSAKCKFCAHQFMRRKKDIMSKELFEKVVRDYVDIGGGALTIAPVVGECLIDTYFLERLRYCRRFKKITHIGFHTNLIDLDRWSDDEIMEILESVNVWNCSVGPNRKIYRDMFGVDCFERTVDSLERIYQLSRCVKHKPLFALNGRACRRFFKEDERIKRLAKALIGCRIKWHAEYCDWGGFTSRLPHGASVHKNVKRRARYIPCILPLMQSVVFSDGRVGLCGCADFDAVLVIGDVQKEKLNSILSGENRKGYIFSFSERSINDYCLKCTFYRPVDIEEINQWKEGTNPFHSG